MFRKKRVLLLIETSRSAGRKIIEGVSRYVIENQNWLINLNERHIIDYSPTWLNSWQGDGIITRTADANIHEVLKRKKLPFVELHGDNQKILSDVLVDETQIGQMAANHLWSRGYQNFAFFALGNAWWIEKRRKEFSAALYKLGAKCRTYPHKEQMEIFPSSIVDDKTLRKIARWVKSLPKPVGLWAATDLYAFYVLEACQMSGVAVPEEIAVLGTDNDELLCRVLSPQLSSIDINAREIGYQAALLLEKRMHGENGTDLPVVTNPSHIEIRQSTDTIAIPDADIAQAIRYIRDYSSSHEMSVSSVAEWVGISSRTLQLKFKKLLFCTPEEEITKTRLEHACRLLRDSDIKISMIGSVVGFASSSHFFRLFQKKYGVTPLIYRNQYFKKLEENFSR